SVTSRSLLSDVLIFHSLQLLARAALCPYTTLFRSRRAALTTAPPPGRCRGPGPARRAWPRPPPCPPRRARPGRPPPGASGWSSRSEEHTSELQSRENLVCRLLIEKKKHNYFFIFLS